MTTPKPRAFVPPFPERLATHTPLWRRLQIARQNFLAMWLDQDFSNEMSWIRVLKRDVALVNSPKLVKEAFLDNHAVLQRKSPQMRNALELLLGDGLFVSDGAVWAERRKIVGPIIHGSKVPDFAPVMIDVVTEFHEKWAKLGDGAEIDALSEFAEMTSEVISRAIFGTHLGQSYAAEIVRGFSDFQSQVNQLDLLSMLGVPSWVPRFRGRGVRKSARRIRTVLDHILTRFEEEREGADTSVIAALLDARDADGRPLSRDAIRNEATVIFMAGHETTANTLAWAWYLLSQADTVRETLFAELDTVVGDRQLTFADVARLPYTRAVVTETLRLYPPVPMLAREALEDVTIGARKFRKGSLVLAVAWLLHRNPNLWPNADSFEPDRFIEKGDRNRYKKPPKYAYVPFAVGPRICAGLTFGETETILALAILAQSFRPELKAGTNVQPVCRLTLRPGDSLPMIIRKRK